MPRQSNTKEKIISSAFLMYRKMRFKEFSLSDIAQDVGISKTAIFRHFKNKAELVSIMNERFFAAFEELAKKIESESGKRTLEATRKCVEFVFEFNRKYPGYAEYYVQALMGKKGIVERMIGIMNASHLGLPKYDIFQDEKGLLTENMIPLYIEITILNFLIEGGRVIANGTALECDFQEFQQKVATIIFEGLGKEKNPISAERRKELDVLCRMKLGEYDEIQDRFYEAFLKAIQKNITVNITVEDIANELEMAKSSMYAFFSNKTDYMRNMLRLETNFFSEVLQEKCLLAKDIDEMIYILIRSEVNYFTERPQVVLMHAFFTFHDKSAFEDSVTEHDFDFFSSSLPANFDLGFGEAKILFIKWISVLAVCFMFMGKKYSFPPKWRDFFISTIFEFIECGTKSCVKQSAINN